MRHLKVPDAIRRTTEEHFRSCGANANECLVIWVAPARNLDRVAAAIHLKHAGSAVSTEVDARTLYDFNMGLVTSGQSAVAQLHTHPGAAFHSATDDAYPLVHTKGFTSIVVPRFGEFGLLGLRECFVAEHQGSGAWRRFSREEIDSLIAWLA